MQDMALIIPVRLAAACDNGPERAAWLARLPATLRDLQQRWSLTLGTPFDGDDLSCSWVAPVTLATGATAVLKLSMPHMEGEHEIEGLRFWNGDPMVRLLEGEDDLGAMLLEPCEPGTALRALSEPEQDFVIARLLRRV
jgi:streptomycin 6-kinase